MQTANRRTFGSQFGITEVQLEPGPNFNGSLTIVNDSLRRSSREALKEVFKDKELGADAFNILSSLKNENLNRLPSEVEAGRAVFEQRATETRELFSQNTRKTAFRDLYHERVVGKRKQRQVAGITILGVGVAAGTALASGLTALPIIAASTASLGMWTAASQGISASFQNREAFANREAQSVTKIHAGKTVKAESLAEGLQVEAKTYEDLNLDYKDLLFKKMTGKESNSYKKARSNLAKPVLDAFAEYGLISATTEPENITILGRLNRRLNPKKDDKSIADDDNLIAAHISSFLIPTAEEVTESKNAIEEQNSEIARREQERSDITNALHEVIAVPQLRARNEPDEPDKRKAVLTAKLDPNKDKKIPDRIASFLVPNPGEIIESKRATEKPKNATERLKQGRKEGLSRG